MERKETSINISFKKEIQLNKIASKILKPFGESEPLRKGDKIIGFFIKGKKEFFVIDNEGIRGRTIGKGGKIKENTINLTQQILTYLKRNKNDFKIKSIFREFKINFSLKDKVISKKFKDKIEALLKNKGYGKPDYVSVVLMLRKDKEFIPLRLSFEDNKAYQNNLLTVETIEDLEKEIKKLK